MTTNRSQTIAIDKVLIECVCAFVCVCEREHEREGGEREIFVSLGKAVTVPGYVM